MTREKAINELKILREEYWDDDGYGHETQQYDDTITAIDMAIKALEMVNDFETAQIITGGRLNGRTYAYKCGLVNGKRLVLDKISIEIEEIETYDGLYIGRAYVLEIIDKYMAESEEV